MPIDHYLLQVFELQPTPTFIIEVVGNNFIVAAYNDAVCNFLNINKIDLQKKTATAFFKKFSGLAPQIIDSLLKNLTEITVKKTIFQTDFFKNNNQSLINNKDIQFQFAPIVNEAKKVTHIVGSFQKALNEIIAEKYNAEKKLVDQSKSLINQLERQAHIGSWEYNLITNTVQLSNEFFRICGYEPGGFESTFKNTIKLIHPDDFVTASNIYKNAIATCQHYELEKRIIRPNGEIRYIKSIGDIQANEQGIAAKIYGVFVDITDTKKQQKEIEQTNYLLKNAQRIVQVGNWEFDFTNDIIYWSDEVYRIFDWEKQPNHTLCFNEFIQLIHDDDKETVIKGKKTAEKNSNNIDVELTIISKKGQQKVVHLLAEHQYNEQTNSYWLYGAISNITEVSSAQQKIIESEKSYKYLFENNPSPMFIWDFETHFILECNEEALLKYGYNKKEFLQLRIEDIRPKEDIPELLQSISSVEAYGDIHKKIWRHSKKEGTIMQVALTGHIITYNGRPASLVQINDITEQQNTIKNLVASENKLRIATKIAKLAYWNWKTNLNEIVWSEEIYNIFETTKNEFELLYESYNSSIHISDRSLYTNAHQYAIKNKTKINIEYRIVLPNRKIKWVQEIGYINTENNAVFEGTLQDITEKKQAATLLNNAFKLAKIGSWEINVEKGTVYWSDITKEIREAPENYNPTLASGLQHFKKGIDRDTIVAKVKASMDNGIPWDEELQIITFKGNEKWIRTIGEAEFKDGVCVKIYGSFQDIDARKKAEMQLLEVFKEKNSILESIGDAFFTVDKNGIVTYWNNVAAQLFNIPKEMALGQLLQSVLKINKTIKRYFSNAIANKKAQQFETLYEALDIWLEVSVYPTDDGLTAYIKDMTERKYAETKLHELNKNLEKHSKDLANSNFELEQFAYVASHDLQEPLRMVTSFITQLQKKYNDVIDDRGKQYMHFAVDGANRMRQIILDLLEYSRIGRKNDTVTFVDLNEIVNDVIKLYQKVIKEKKAIITTEKLPIVTGFRSPLLQVFQNLISNSLKYQSPNTITQIKISYTATDTFWQFAIEDNGIGIAQDYFDKIFIIFQRLHAKDTYSGTGIGLAITKKIIEGFGGKIWVTSTEKKGSTFYFTLLKNYN